MFDNFIDFFNKIYFYIYPNLCPNFQVFPITAQQASNTLPVIALLCNFTAVYLVLGKSLMKNSQQLCRQLFRIFANSSILFIDFIEFSDTILSFRAPLSFTDFNGLSLVVLCDWGPLTLVCLFIHVARRAGKSFRLTRLWHALATQLFDLLLDLMDLHCGNKPLHIHLFIQ